MNQAVSLSCSDLPRALGEHIEELRSRLLVCLAAWLACSATAYAFSPRVLELLVRPPVEKLVFLTPTEPFFAILKLSLALGLLAALPLWLHQAWGFVSIGLEPGERRTLLSLLPPAYALFLLGTVFGLKVLVPLSMRFLMSFQGPQLVPYLGLSSYLGFVATLSLGTGLLFQLPVAMAVLSSLGLVSWKTLSAHRKHAFLALLILAALLTPGPDVVSQLALALPAYLLFEISVLVARLAGRTGP